MWFRGQVVISSTRLSFLPQSQTALPLATIWQVSSRAPLRSIALGHGGTEAEEADNAGMAKIDGPVSRGPAYFRPEPLADLLLIT